MLRRLTAALFAVLLMIQPAFAADDDIARLYNFTSGTTIQSSQVNGEFNQLISRMNGKMSRSGVNTVSGNNTFSGANTFSGVTTFSEATTGLKTDKINEYTSTAGVTADSVLLKDGMVTVSGTPAANGTIGYTSNQFKGYRNGSALNFLMTGDAAIVSAVTARSSNTILGASDNGGVFVCTSSFTQTLTAAATLGSTWSAYIRNAGTGIITIDPNSSETIDGLPTINVYQGEALTIVCDGSNFYTLGRQKGVVLIQSQSASGSTSIDFTTGLTDTEFKKFILQIDDLVCATDGKAVLLRASQAASFISGASDYSWVVTGDRISASATGGSAGDTSINLTLATGATSGLGNAAGEYGTWEVTIFNPSGSSLNKEMIFDGSYNRATDGERIRMVGSGRVIKNNTAIDGLRVLMDSGNITSGTFRLWGVR